LIHGLGLATRLARRAGVRGGSRTKATMVDGDQRPGIDHLLDARPRGLTRFARDWFGDQAVPVEPVS
jgi:hypothetical protein